IWKRLVRDSLLPRPWTLILTGSFLTFLLTVPVTMSLLRNVPRETLAPLAFAAFVWVGLLSTLFWILAGSDLTRLLLRKFQRSGTTPEIQSPEKRATLNRLFAGSVALSGTTVGGVAVENALAWFSVVEGPITLDRLPQSCDAFRIAQLSDVHVGPTIGPDYVEKMVRVTNSLRPDLIAI